MSIGVISLLTMVALLVTGFWLLRHVDWKRKLNEPVVVSALVVAVSTVLVAAANTVGTVVSSEIVAANERAAAIEKLRASTLLSVIQQYEPTMVPARNEANQKQRMRILIQAGIIPDEGGSICMALIGEGCPIEVLKNRKEPEFQRVAR
jgi:hypothetical protein